MPRAREAESQPASPAAPSRSAAVSTREIIIEQDSSWQGRPRPQKVGPARYSIAGRLANAHQAGARLRGATRASQSSSATPTEMALSAMLKIHGKKPRAEKSRKSV